MTHPIPTTALDDRLAFVGTAGSGKTYCAGTAVEAILGRGDRAIIIDPLGVWWGLRLLKDVKTPSPFKVAIFGGAHGDLPITEHAGGLIGEAVSGIAESCIIDLSGIGTKAGERRFMLAFLTALYRKTAGEPVHIVFDEADMFAPQRLLDKEGEAAKLLGMMETIVRRGRIKGFIPYLITQRPAVLSKDVLSQSDGLIAFKLTSSQDRDAIGDWVQGQADKTQWREMWGSLATMQRGQGLLWIPGRSILKTVQFPEKITFDSSRTPKRGEKRQHAALKPLDLGALKEKLSAVETETKANDPKVLKFELATLKKQMADGVRQQVLPDPKAIESAYDKGFAHGFDGGYSTAAKLVTDGITAAVASAAAAYRPPAPGQPKPPTVNLQRPSPHHGNGEGETMPGPHRKLLTVLAQYPQGRTNKQLAVLAGYAHNGGAFKNPLSALRSRGWAQGTADKITATSEGIAALGEWLPLPTGTELQDYWFRSLAGPPAKLLRALCDAFPKGMDKLTLAQATGYDASGGAFKNPLARLRSLELVTGRGGEDLRASEDLF